MRNVCPATTMRSPLMVGPRTLTLPSCIAISKI
jgi:hypothetical protein